MAAGLAVGAGAVEDVVDQGDVGAGDEAPAGRQHELDGGVGGEALDGGEGGEAGEVEAGADEDGAAAAQEVAEEAGRDFEEHDGEAVDGLQIEDGADVQAAGEEEGDVDRHDRDAHPGGAEGVEARQRGQSGCGHGRGCGRGGGSDTGRAVSGGAGAALAVFGSGLSEVLREALTRELMAARRAKGVAMRAGDAAGREAARARVEAAKVGLGERGAVWWDDGAPDYSRRMAVNTPYAEWWASVGGMDRG